MACRCIGYILLIWCFRCTGMHALIGCRLGRETEEEARLKDEQERLDAEMAEVQEKVEAATQATQVLNTDEHFEPETMKQVCKKAGKSQTEAQKLIHDTRAMMLHRQKELNRRLQIRRVWAS